MAFTLYASAYLFQVINKLLQAKQAINTSPHIEWGHDSDSPQSVLLFLLLFKLGNLSWVIVNWVVALNKVKDRC